MSTAPEATTTTTTITANRGTNGNDAITTDTTTTNTFTDKDIIYNDFWPEEDEEKRSDYYLYWECPIREDDDDDDGPYGGGKFNYYNRHALAKQKISDLLYTIQSTLKFRERTKYYTKKENFNLTIKPIIAEFRHDDYIVRSACETFPLWIDYILQELHGTNSNLLDDHKFIMDITLKQHHETAWGYIPPLRYATDRIKNDKVFLLHIFKFVCINAGRFSIGKDPHENVKRKPFAPRKHLECFPNQLYDDREFMYQIMVRKQVYYNTDDKGCVLEFISPRLLHDRQFLIDLIKSKETNDHVMLMADVILNHGPNWINDDSKMLLWIYDNNHYYHVVPIEKATTRLKCDKSFIMEAMEMHSKKDYKYPHPLRFVLDDCPLRDDLDVLMFAVNKDGESLRYASPRLQANRAVVADAVRQSGAALRYAAPSLRNDKQIALVAVTHDANFSGVAIHHVSDKLLNDFDVAIAAVGHKGELFEHLPERFKRNRQIVLSAVQSYGYAIECVEDPELRNDRQIVLAAVQSNGLAIQYVTDPKLRNDRQIVLTAVQECGKAITYVTDPELRNDFEVALHAVQKWEFALTWLNNDLKNNKKIVLASVRNRHRSIKYASSNLKKDPDVILQVELSKFGGMQSTDVFLKPNDTPPSFFPSYFEQWGGREREDAKMLIYYCLKNRNYDLIVPAKKQETK